MDRYMATFFAFIALMVVGLCAAVYALQYQTPPTTCFEGVRYFATTGTPVVNTDGLPKTCVGG